MVSGTGRKRLVYFNEEGEPITNSLILAGKFNRKHYDILRAIRNKKRMHNKEFAAKNFSEGSYKDVTGKSNPTFELTRDGFWIIASGFTGRKASLLQSEFVDQFNLFTFSSMP